MAVNYRNPKTNLFRDTSRSEHTAPKTAPAIAADWSSLRKAHPLNQLLPATRRWLDSLPASSRPIEMVKTYPRIANRIALAWNDPKNAQEVMDDLLIDQRGGRQGFPPLEKMELLRLRSILDGAHSLQVRT
jgi:hypothetical protein